MALQGYRTTLKISGAAVTLTSEPMSSYSTVAHTFQANTSTKRIFSSTAAVSFKSSSYTLLAADIVSVNYLFGAVTLSTTFTGSTRYKGSPKASGKYVPVTTVAGGHKYQLTQTVNLYDDTDYTSTGWMSRCPGLKDVSVSIDRYDNLDLGFFNLIGSGAKVLLEIRPGGVGNAARGWFLVKDENRSGDINTLESATVNLELDTKPAIDSWSWGTP